MRKKIRRRKAQPPSSLEREKPGWFIDPIGSVSKKSKPLNKLVRRKRADRNDRARTRSDASRGRMVKTTTRKAIR